ncbi:MAG: ABC transporter ATP-binding protein [Reyranella sp.]|nr:ABC transporter ATP-binding protein [Reyranella sp.]
MQRGVSMVFQSHAIWPHMSVFDNVAYGLRVRKQSNADIQTNVERALDLVQMRHLADRGASKLSGGQQQRVALARAIAFSPTVVLFDEPLSNLDAKLRAEMRVELRELQRRLGITSVYVTLKVVTSHKPHGRETEVAARTAYIEFEPRAGDNQVPGKVRQRLFHGDFVQYAIDSAVGPLNVRRPPINLSEEGAPVTVSLSPEHCVLLEG